MGFHDARTEERVSAVPGRIDARGLRAAVERRLDDLSPRSPGDGDLDTAVRHALLSPGKRLRPLLTLLAARELGAGEWRALDAGCALEMVHAASLVLDDLPCMDDASTRRGQPTTHRTFGQDVAVLASVTLLARAFAVLGAAPGLSPEQRVRLTMIAAEAVGSEGLAGGQYRDLKGAQMLGALVGVSDGNHRKTGTLFVAAVLMAGVIADAAEDRVEELCSFAAHIGQAFQIMDDLQDGSAKSGADAPPCEDAGKVTVLSFLDRDGAQRRLEAHLRQARAALRPGSDLAIFTGEVFARAFSPELHQAHA